MKVDTARFTSSHGKAPRGKGRWAFEARVRGSWELVSAPGQMTITEAKRWAVQSAREMGADSIQLAP